MTNCQIVFAVPRVVKNGSRHAWLKRRMLIFATDITASKRQAERITLTPTLVKRGSSKTYRLRISLKTNWLRDKL
jgi:hypothetical protein